MLCNAFMDYLQQIISTMQDISDDHDKTMNFSESFIKQNQITTSKLNHTCMTVLSV